MLHPRSPVFNRLLDYINSIPVIDCHEHMLGPGFVVPFREPIAALIADYFYHDLHSAGADERTVDMFRDDTVSTDAKWPQFEQLWKRTEHTAYARVTKLILRDVYGVTEMSRAGLDRVAEQLAMRDEQFHRRLLDEANIRVVLADALGWIPGDFGQYLRGEQVFPDHFRVFIPMPLFHVLTHHDTDAKDWLGVQRIGMWADRHITSLDEYLESVYIVLQKAKARGAIGIKDQCAYNRTLDYEVTPRADAERIFNKLLTNPRTVFGWPDSKPLDDFLFHQFMRFARDLELPVQIHTGHMAGWYNRVDKANVRLFTSVLELHQDVRFDLFHGNYPYMGDALFVAKNYPNAVLGLCWLPIINPIYAVDLLTQTVVSVPHSKMHGFGGDFQDHPEYSVASLKLAREVIAAALTGLMERGWLDEDQALQIAADWLFHNPNEFYRLGLAWERT